MVKRLAGGTFGSLLALAVPFAGGEAAFAPFAAAQETTTRTATDRLQPNDVLAQLRGLKTDDATQRTGQFTGQLTAQDDPFNDGPLTDGERSRTTNSRTTQSDAIADPNAAENGDQTGDQTGDQQSAASRTQASTGSAGESSDDSQGRAQPVQPETEVLDPINTASPDARANVRERPEQSGTKRRAEEEDPFLPPGFRAGTWQVFTRLEQAIGYSSNNTFTAGGKPGVILQTDGNVTLRSDWSRHEAEIQASGTLVRALGDEQGIIPSAGVNGRLRLDLIDGYSATLRGNYDYSTEALSSTSLSSNVAERPGVHAYGGSAELARSGGYFDFSLRGSADRTTYEEASLSGGGLLMQKDRNNTLYKLTARTAFGPTPSLKPFVEAAIGKRVYDEPVDRNGEDRSGTLFDLRAGVEFDLHEKLTGEMAVGYAWEDFNAPTLKTLDAVTLNGTLDWSPERDTHLRLTASTGFGGSTTAGDNGSVVYNVLAEAVRRVRDNFAVNAKASYGRTDYDTSGGSDHDYKVGAGVEYWISRYLSLTADVEYERFDSVTANNSWDATSVRVGIALQR